MGVLLEAFLLGVVEVLVVGLGVTGFLFWGSVDEVDSIFSVIFFF